MSKIIKELRHRPTGSQTGSRVFFCLGDLLAHYGRTAPGRNAILAPERAPVTYGALWTRTNHMVRGLQSLGVGPNDRVAVVLPDGPDTAMTMIAVACGAVCVPLNPGFTADEWQRYFKDLRIAALLTRADMDSASRGVASTFGIPVIYLSPRPSEGPSTFSLVGSATRPTAGGELTPTPDDAFILLTSGTTSRPKIVPLTHASVCLSAYNAGAALALGPRDRLLNVLPLFHAHGLISGVLAALAAGSSVVCTTGFDATAFFVWLTEFRPTWYTAVPAIHRALLSAAGSHKHRADWCSLRIIRSASSSLQPDVLAGLEALFGVPVIETYGMTEAASQIAANPLDRRKPGSVGRPVGVEIAIMNGEGQRLQVGERGEIALQGPTITRGYDNNAAATESAFRDGWFRTGDLGYFDHERYLFIVGRIKDVINRGGQKVAPAEVEEVLLSHPDVVDAVAFSIPHRRLGEDVAAAVVLRPGAKVTAHRVRAFARERLARFKVPGLIRIVPEIPKGPGGKIKRGALVAALSITLPTERVERGKMVPPRSELEWQLAKIWADLLEFDQIGVEQDVFALGADSFTLTQMLSRLRARFGVSLPMRALFEAPTVRALARQIEAARETQLNEPAFDIVCVKGNGPKPVSIVQEHVLRIERELPGLPQFNLPFAYRLQGPLNVPALEQSLAEVVRRHESLRTGFGWMEERPVALVVPAAEIDSSLIVEEFAAWTPTGNNRAKALLFKKAELRAEQEAWTPFDMTRAPLLRARLLRLGADDHVLLLMLHHIIVDGWSIGVFIEELSEFYRAFAADRQAQLPEPALQFSDFARWQRLWSGTGAATRLFEYWKEHLRLASPVFRTDSDLGATLLSSGIAHEPVHLPNDLVARLRGLGRSQGGTLFMTLLAGFKALLLARSGRNDLCVATAMANRPQQQMEGVIGPFENTTLIRTRIDADLSFQDALNRVRNSVLEAYARQELPFDILAARLAEEDGLDPASFIQVFFALQNSYRRPLKLPDVAVRPFGNVYREGQPVLPIDRSWLTVMLKETQSGVIGSCGYKNELFEPNTLQHWIADYKTILDKAATNPEIQLGRLTDC